MPRYVIAACRNAPAINDRDFPVAVRVFDAPSRIRALRIANESFNDDTPVEPWTHLRIVDGPPREYVRSAFTLPRERAGEDDA